MDSQSTQLRMQAFAVRWTAAQPVVAAYIASMVTRHHDAEDILQRTAAALVMLHDQYDPAKPFVGWAIGAARIEILRYRQERRRETAVFDTDTVEAVAAAFERVGPRLLDCKGALDRCVGKLKGRVRQIFELRYRDDLSPTQIAERLSRTTQSVFVTLHRGRAAVWLCLERSIAIENFDGARGGHLP